ncbi:hypothetical protein P2H44_03470 [Albimonas sp. CAU 1670]|uniref:hypothetical protein n=1 Tax=Albimonas sp. CAU 1670 TaxID=3032599 RepID=UPI0023DCD8CB|nr:hypothetical protein [Albimonas sp. CAU 1670]MDF2231604.1 hypothetical protein [Albimonas sp. CAU 1670]
MSRTASLAVRAAAAREAYLAFFSAMLEAAASSDVEGVSEFGVAMDGSDLLDDVYRFDLVLKEPDGELTSLDFAMEVPPGQDPPAFVERIGEAVLHVFRLRWDDVDLHHDLSEPPQDALTAWFHRWFDAASAPGAAADLAEETELPFPAGRLHSAELSPGRVTVDFGTAPPEALVELVTLLESAGARAVQIDLSREDGVEADAEEDEDPDDLSPRSGTLLH